MEKEEFMREGMDLKRLFLCLLNKIWVVVIAAVIGALLGSGLYLLINVTFAKQLDYTATAKYYLDYAMDNSGEIIQEYNGYTWNEIMSTDPILGYTMTLLPNTMVRDEVAKTITATTPYDYRVLIITVVTDNQEDTQLIATKTTESLLHFVKEKKEFQGITLMKYDEPQQIKVKLQTTRAAIAGILAAVSLCFIIMALYYILDDSVYTAEEMEKRYHFKTLGIITKKKSEKSEKEILLNLNYICKNEGKTAIVKIDNLEDLNILHKLKSEFDFIEFELSDMQEQDYIQLRNCENIIIGVAWGNKNGTTIKHSISQLEKQGCKITCAILYNGSNGFLAKYFKTK